MTSPQQKVSVHLTGSIDETQVEETFGQLWPQGSSPSLNESRNTRLTMKLNSCVRAPEIAQVGPELGPSTQAYAIVPNERARNYALLTTWATGSRVVAEDGFSDSGTGRILDRKGGDPQNAFVPFAINRAGAISQERGAYVNRGYNERSSIVACRGGADEIWNAWTCQGLEGASFELNIPRVYVACYDADMAVRAGALKVYDLFAFGGMQPLGLTGHGGYGVRLWVYNFGSDTQRLVQISLENLGTGITAGPPVEVMSPGAQLGVRFGVSSDGGQYAYLAYVVDGSVTATVVKYDVSTNTAVLTRTVTLPVAATLGSDVACSYVFAGPTPYILVAFGLADQTVTVAYTEDMTRVLEPHSMARQPGAFSSVLAQLLYVEGDVPYRAVFGHSYRNGFQLSPLADERYNYTKLWGREIGTGALTEYRRIGGMVIYDKGATWVQGSYEAYPLLFTVPLFWASEEPLDPQLVGFLVGGDVVSPVARLGCVRGAMAPIHVPNANYNPPASPLPWVFHQLYIPYRLQDVNLPGRWAMLDTSPQNHAVVQDRDGVALVAGALPFQWDGLEVYEMGGPLTMPRLVTRVTTVTPPGLGQGSYGYTGIYEWRDGAGLYHRSMPYPTIQVSITEANKGIEYDFLLPVSMRYGDKHFPITPVPYESGKDGTSYLRGLPLRVGSDDVLFIRSDFVVDADPLGGSLIYSRGLAGEELLPQPPPPLTDITICGSRCWGIDAEIPTRLVYSKMRIAGIGFEFSPALEVIVPLSAGVVVAIRELSGTLVAFGERGIYQIADGGPNNAGQGASYGSPYKISEVGTHSRDSVISTPQGVMFLDNLGTFSLASGGGVVQLPGAKLPLWERVVGSYALEGGSEAVFVGPDLMERAFNYQLNRWTRWDMPTYMSLTAQSAITRDHGILYSAQTGMTYTVLSENLNPQVAMGWETDWVLFGGDVQDYVVIYDVIFNGRYQSDFGLIMELLTEYDGTVATTHREWTNAELLAIQGPTGRFTVRMEPVRQDARGFKIKISERIEGDGIGDGLLPGMLTVVYSVDGLTYEESNIPGSHK